MTEYADWRQRDFYATPTFDITYVSFHLYHMSDNNLLKITKICMEIYNPFLFIIFSILFNYKHIFINKF